jgi:hypothetical protein
MNKTPEIKVHRHTPVGHTGGLRRATRVEIFGRKKGRSRRIHLPRQTLACRWENGVQTEVFRQARGRFVVESRSDVFRVKKTFPTESAALDYFHEDVN